MGVSNSTNKTSYFVTISILSTDDIKILYSDITNTLNDIQKFIVDNMEKIGVDTDDWFKQTKIQIDAGETTKYNEDAEREVPRYQRVAKPIYRYTRYDGDSDYYDSGPEDELVEVVGCPMKNPYPYNYYIQQGFDKCNNIADFFNETNYSGHKPTGIEYFMDFIRETYKISENEKCPLQIDVKTITGDYTIE